MSPSVSVVTITYNHEPWIAKNIEGVLGQVCSFPVEHIIAEDCSTDNTRAICERLAANHPEIIKLLPSEKNLGALQNEKRAMAAASGRYIAFCEGDDYWTEPTKLQRQIDFLEGHPDYSVCFTLFRNMDSATGELSDCEAKGLFTGVEEGVDIDMETLFCGWYLQPMTMVFRQDAMELGWYDHYKYFRDIHLIYHLMLKGKCRLMKFDSGIRVKHQGGMASKISTMQYYAVSLPMDREFYLKTKDDGPRKQYLETLQTAINPLAHNGQRWQAIVCGLRIFCITGRPGTLIRNLRNAIFLH